MTQHVAHRASDRIRELEKERRDWEFIANKQQDRAEAAEQALLKISLALGGTDEWTDQETMIADVVSRAEAAGARAKPST